MSMTPALLDNMVKHGVIAKDATRVPPASEAMAHPEADEVMVYMDFFAALPLGPYRGGDVPAVRGVSASDDTNFVPTPEFVLLAVEDLPP